MCEPISATTAMYLAAGSAAASAGASYYGQQQQQEYQEGMAEYNATTKNRAVQENLNRSRQVAEQRQADLDEQTAEAQEDNYLATLKATDTAKVIAGAKGIQGNSVDSLMSDMLRTGSGNAFKISKSAAAQRGQIQQGTADAEYNATLSKITPNIYKPSSGVVAIGALGQGLSTGLNMYSGMNQAGFINTGGKA